MIAVSPAGHARRLATVGTVGTVVGGGAPTVTLTTATATTDTQTETIQLADVVVEPEVPWVTIVWNDPVNLMSYVTFVFMKLLGHPRGTAEKLMMDVHQKGRASVSTGSREKMEVDVAKLQAAGLWATLQQDN